MAASADGRVSVVSPDLTRAAQFHFGQKPNDLAISPAGDVLAICADDRVSLLRTSDGREQFTVPVGPRAAASFGDDGALIWTLCSDGKENNITVQLRDARDGRILRESSFPGPSTDAQCSLEPQARRGGIAIWIGAGEDGQWIFWAHDSGRAIAITQAEGISVCTPPCFNTEGTAFLVASAETLSRWSFPEMACTASIGEWPWSDTADDSLGTSVAWAGARRAVVTTNENRMYLVDLDTANVVDECVMDGHPVVPMGDVYPELEGETGLTTDLRFLVAVAPSRVLSVHRDGETDRLVLSDTTRLAP